MLICNYQNPETAQLTLIFGMEHCFVTQRSKLLYTQRCEWLPEASLLVKEDLKTYMLCDSVHTVVVQSLNRVRLCNPWTATRQAPQSFTVSWSLLNLMSIELVMPTNHLILCRPLLLLPSVFPSIRVFSSESALCISWPKHWNFSFGISPSSEYSGLISLGLTLLISSLFKGPSRVFSSTTVQKHQFFGAQPSLWSNSHIHNWYWKNHSFDYMDLCWQSDVSVF